MDVIDIDKLNNAIIYLQRMTNGYNPVNNMPVEEDSVLNNPNVIRCMYFVKEVLEEVRQNEVYKGRRRLRRKDSSKKSFPIDSLNEYKYVDDKTITQFVEQLNERIDLNTYNTLNFTPIRNWLLENEYLYVTSDESGKNKTLPTEKGKTIEIYTKHRNNNRGQEFDQVFYGKTAQELIVANMLRILET